MKVRKDTLIIILWYIIQLKTYMENINSNKFTITFNKIKCSKKFDSFELIKDYINIVEEIFTSLHLLLKFGVVQFYMLFMIVNLDGKK